MTVLKETWKFFYTWKYQILFLGRTAPLTHRENADMVIFLVISPMLSYKILNGYTTFMHTFTNCEEVSQVASERINGGVN